MPLHVVRYLVFSVGRQDTKSISSCQGCLIVELVIHLVLSGCERLWGLRLDLVQQVSRYIVVTVNMLALFTYWLVTKSL